MRAEAHETNAKFEDEYWWYVGRRRIVLDWLGTWLKGARLRQPMVLDLGCGAGATLEALTPLAHAIGADLSPLALGECKRRGLGGRLVRCDFKAPPFADDTFDVIVLLDVLEHLENDREALLMAHRLLKDGGLLVVTVPAYEFLWSGEDYVSQHHRRYVRRTLLKRVVAAGFAIRRSTYFNALLFPVMASVILFRRAWVPGSRVQSNVRPLPALINRVLTFLFSMERIFLRSGSFPYGGSILCLGVKDHGANREPAKALG